jgi:hypothetical protein
MSTTWSIVCHETKQYCWIGQGADLRSFYSGSTEAMERLGRFLQATIGKSLVVMCDDRNDYYPGYVEFEDQEGAAMSNENAWDSDVYSPKYANEFTMDLSGGIGLNVSDAHDTSKWICAWHVGADSAMRHWIDGKLVSVKTPEPALSMALLGELAGIEIVADDTVSINFEMDSAAVKVAVNDRVVVTGTRQADGGCEWRAVHETGG